MAVITVSGLPQVTAVATSDIIHVVQSSVDKRATITQVIAAISNDILPAGTVLASAWNNDPATLGIKALPLIGQGVLRASYEALDNVVYCGDSNNATASAFFRADSSDGTNRNTAGIYLMLADTLGRVIRGLDPSGITDPGGASRDLGSPQYDTFQGHDVGIGINDPAGAVFTEEFLGVYTRSTSSATKSFNLISDGINGTPRTGVETRSKNVAFNYMITY